MTRSADTRDIIRTNYTLSKRSDRSWPFFLQHRQVTIRHFTTAKLRDNDFVARYGLYGSAVSFTNRTWEIHVISHMFSARMLRQIASRLITPNDCDRSEARRTWFIQVCVADTYTYIFDPIFAVDDCRHSKAELALPHDRSTRQMCKAIISLRYLHQ